MVDEGPGIPLERREDVFDKYPNWRPDGYEQAAGSGLGLFLVRGIVDGHDGEVVIVDAPGGGTMLRIRIPRTCGGIVADGSRPVTLLICDDHRVLTDALAIVVGLDDGLELVAPPSQDPQSAIALCAEFLPDVVLMDVDLKAEMSGIDATRAIKENSPATKVIIMTAHDDDRLLVDAVEAGASGFLSKDDAAQEVLAAVKAAADGEVLIDPATLARLLPQVAREREMKRDALALLNDLTDREREILSLLAQGMRNDDIAAKLYISPQTVQTHVRNILGKLRVHSKLEAVAFAVRYGAISV